MKILLAEDTADLNRVETAILTKEGYEVSSFYDGTSAYNALRNEKFDMAVLDIMMPGMSGIDILKDLRDRNDDTPVMMLTAKSEVDDKVMGLDLGANDYMVKPFSIKEFLARVRAMARTVRSGHEKSMTYKDLELNADDFSLRSTNSVGLSNHEYDLMKLFLSNPDKALDNEYILDHVWTDEKAGDDTVWLYVSYLNDKLYSISSNVRIDGQKGQSYKLTERDN
jgi:DNA-binding response OmpR family regulator